MTKSQTYSTRHLTARDHKLLDALESDPRYRKIAQAIRPPEAKGKAADMTADPLPKPNEKDRVEDLVPPHHPKPLPTRSR
jgi:hypothetical protein